MAYYICCFISATVVCTGIEKDWQRSFTQRSAEGSCLRLRRASLEPKCHLHNSHFHFLPARIHHFAWSVGLLSQILCRHSSDDRITIRKQLICEIGFLNHVPITENYFIIRNDGLQTVTSLSRQLEKITSSGLYASPPVIFSTPKIPNSPSWCQVILMYQYRTISMNFGKINILEKDQWYMKLVNGSPIPTNFLSLCQSCHQLYRTLQIRQE